MAADVVAFPYAALGEHLADRGAVVPHEQPVAHVAALAVHRQGLFAIAFRIIRGTSFSGNWYGP